MPPKKDKEVVFFLTNVGRQPKDGDPDYVEKAKEVMKLITEKKILLRPKDEIGIMLVGEAKKNESSFKKPTIKTHEVPSWEIVEEILAIEESDEPFDDWFTALSELVKYMKDDVVAARVILILLFECDNICPAIDSTVMNTITRSLTKLDVQLLWIGSKQLNDIPPEKYNNCEKIIMKMVQEVNGQYMTMEKTLPSLRIFKRHKDTFMAWKCPLEIGDIKIGTAMYVQTVEDMKGPTFQNVDTVEDDEEGNHLVEHQRDYVDRHREAHSMSETIPGYMYGRKFIPVAEADQMGMDFDFGEKAFTLHGFVTRDSIKLEDLGGDGSRIVIPDGPTEEKAFYCLLQAMVENDLVGIVRRVYRAKTEPKMGVLIPRMDDPGDVCCLIYVELAYVETRRVPQSRPLDSIIKGLSEEKRNAASNLIDSMMLTDTDEKGNDLFAPGKVPSPSLQYLWNCVSHRALNPEGPIPPIDENLAKLLELPEWIKIKQELPLQKVEELFPITLSQDESTTQDDTSAEILNSTLNKVEKTEIKIKNNIDESMSLPQESNVDLDELFDEDMDF